MRMCRFMNKEMIMKWNRIFGCFAIGAMFWACSGSDDKDVVGGASGDSGITAVTDWEVAGVTQKGPFAKGSAVTVRGIDCKTMKFTDEIFEGEVKSDKGDFAVEGVTLKSTCAVLEVTGQYLNELSGKKSSEKITLRVLTDLENRKTVNVNVLTELEYGRAKYLVTEKKKPVADAKKRAGKEVLAAFGIEGDFGSSEDLTIFEGGDGNAALLAVSVLMQAETDEAGLTKRMDKFADSFAETGKWNDDETKTTIEEWLVAATAEGTLDSIRKSIDGWEYANEVPPFEKYIEVFGDSVVPPDDEDVDEGSSSSGKGKSSGDSANSSSSDKSKSGDDSVKSSSSSGAKTQSSGKDSSAATSSSDKSKSGDDSVKSSSSSGAKTPSSGKDSSVTTSSSGEGESSSSSAVPPGTVVLATPCKTDSTDTCEYGTLTDERDGQIYKTVKIGNQWWMAESLKYGETGSAYYDGYDVVAESDIYFSEYGLLYGRHRYGYDDDAAVLDACPDGWHVPDTTEWNTLFAAVGGISYADTALRATFGWDINIGTDAFGFSALPAGHCSAGGCEGLGYGAYFWTSTYGIDAKVSCLYKISFNGPAKLTAGKVQYDLLNMYPDSVMDGAVRCIKD